ncbi:ECF transporter S component [Streptococcus phocae subsp. salmonis]|uniref:ECF transporter S component n=1 Tax=Streptococcus phocae TaxID=119224 RepID=UPI0005311628|nr:ECF transporter S component [Streptococcus phocae]KGR73479.1 membrane protein [Streptococcus phocae subsp. salmonis]
MRNSRLQELTKLAILTALTVVLGRFVMVPTPTGFLTLLDAGIYFTSFYLGSRQGAAVGALSGFLIDVIAGYPQWMIHSLIAHGGQGFFGGWSGSKRWIGLLLASVIMVSWYFVGALLLGYGLAGAAAGIWGNVMQNAFGILIGYMVFLGIKRFEQK